MNTQEPSLPNDSGNSDFLVNEEALHSAAKSLFAYAEEIEDTGRPVWAASSDVHSDLDPSQLTSPKVLQELGDVWRAFRLRQVCNEVEDVAKFLAVHVETAVAMDEFSASMFAEFADPDHYDLPDSSSPPSAEGDQYPE